MKKKDKFFTLMILSGHATKIRRYTFPKVLLRYLATTAVVFFIASFYLLYNYMDMKGKVWEINSLREEANKQRLQIQSFTTGLIDVKRQIQRIREMDTKLRHLTGSFRKRSQGGSRGVGEALKEIEEKKRDDLLSQMHEGLTVIKEEVTAREGSLKTLIEFFEGYRYRRNSSPSLWPLKGIINSGFGYRDSPFSGEKEFHRGIDISCNVGAPVHAPADGIVSYVGYNKGYGRFLDLDHSYGITTMYGHLSKVLIETGERVTRGQVIARCGSSGDTTGPHLHYEVHVYGVPTNPFKFVL